MSDNNQCSICMENIVDKWVTKCNHSFCTKCIFDWGFTNKSANCPLCRGNMHIKHNINPVTKVRHKYDKNKFYIFLATDNRCFTKGDIELFNDLNNIVWEFYDENKRVKPSEFFKIIYPEHFNKPYFDLHNAIINYKQKVLTTIYNDINDANKN